jgi:hypothetical protein
MAFGFITDITQINWPTYTKHFFSLMTERKKENKAISIAKHGKLKISNIPN